MPYSNNASLITRLYTNYSVYNLLRFNLIDTYFNTDLF